MVVPGKLCKLCRRVRPFSEFVWRDSQGRLGVTGRCVDCRNRGKGWNPTLPILRYQITRHAAERFIERVQPELAALGRGEAFKRARIDMRVLMAAAPFESEWPAWVGDGRRQHGDTSVGFLLIDEATIFLLSGDPNPGRRVIVTVLTKRSEGSSLAA